MNAAVRGLRWLVLAMAFVLALALGFAPRVAAAGDASTLCAQEGTILSSLNAVHQTRHDRILTALYHYTAAEWYVRSDCWERTNVPHAHANALASAVFDLVAGAWQAHLGDDDRLARAMAQRARELCRGEGSQLWARPNAASLQILLDDADGDLAGRWHSLGEGGYGTSPDGR